MYAYSKFLESPKFKKKSFWRNTSILLWNKQQSKHDNTIRFIPNLRLRILRLRLSRTLAFDDIACVRVQFVRRKKRGEPNIVSYKGHKGIVFP